jgi:parallel beta-helix repeat protein
MPTGPSNENIIKTKPVIHAPIFIDSDNAFTPQNGVARGSGTQHDPFVIENLIIEEALSTAIYIRNTTSFFIIQNVVVKRSQNGIVLENVRNGTVRNCLIQDNQIGIKIESCENINIENNTVGPNKENVVIIGEIPSEIKNNVFKNNRYLYEFGSCLQCPHIVCINFLRHELSILNQPKRPSEGEIYLPCIPGALLSALCDVIGDIDRNLGETPLTILLGQVLKDLRCSLFLFWSGHFRNAMQVLRPALENFLAAIYFDYLENGRKEFNKWASEKEEYKISDYLTYIEKKAIRPEGREEWEKRREKIEELYSSLSEYLHASKYKTLERHATCFEALGIDQEKMDKWFSAFTTVITFVLEYLIEIYRNLLEEKTRDELGGLFSPETLSFCQPQRREFLVKFGDLLRQKLMKT